MSKAQPFPTNSSRRARSPVPSSYDVSINTGPTLPLSINRQQARPMTPSSSTGSTATRGSPARPTRSDLRPRQISQYSLNSMSTRSMDRDSISSIPYEPASSSRSRITQEQEGGMDDLETSPKALTAVLNAFQQAGAQRKRAMTNGTLEREQEREREMQEEMQRQKRIKDKVPGRKLNGKTKTMGNIDAVLDRIQDEWAFVIDPDFNPVDLALQLLESSSSGKDVESFRETKLTLSKALKGSVDKHYQAFAAALPHHASVLNHLSATQAQVIDARTALQEAKDALGNKRSDLVQLWSRGHTVEEMLGLLDEIEHLKSIPDALESLMSEKRLLQAAALLIKSLKTINKPEMTEIGAVSDLRNYLVGQESALREILIDELHSHLFLKSFWCESRWAAYTPNQQTLPNVESDNDVQASMEQSPSLSSSTCPPRLKQFLNDLATRPNDPPLDLSGTNFKSGPHQARSFPLASLSGLGVTSKSVEQPHNPEGDSFGYLEIILESLAVLGKLGSALDAVSQRLPSEVYTLVDQTIDEVHERAELNRRLSFYAINVHGRPSSVYVFAGDQDLELSSSFVDASALRLAALESTEKQADHEVLRDLFWSLYSKLDAVTQGLRVVFEVSNRIGSRRDFKDSSGAKPGSLFPLSEMWIPLQSEVRTLLNDYLNDDDKGATAGRNPISSINEILRDSRFYRDQGKQVFRFADTDIKSASKSLRAHENELNHVLRDTVPGLVQGGSDSALQTTLSHLGTDERLIEAEHHRLLIRSDAFHVSVLFRPTLAFLDRVAEVLPSGLESTRASTELLDDFVLNVYLPQLEEKSSMLFHNIVTGHDAFLIDPASLKLSQEPLLKACTQLMALINSLCAMLRTTPFHRENYSRLILSVIIQFYQRCSDRFHDVVARNKHDIADSDILTSGKWAQQDNVAACLTDLMKPGLDARHRKYMCEQETRIELGILEDATISNGDLIGSMHDLSFLSSLHRSITWFVEQLRSLKSTTEEAKSPDITASPTIPLLPTFSDNEHLQLPLSREMSDRFGSLIMTYEQLAQLILFTIRIDIRCRVIHYLNSAIRYGNYRIDQEDSEPDPHIIDLNIELGKADECISSTLAKKQRFFVFEGLETLMEELLISNARYIRFANAYGVKKILRNVLALRQNIKTLSSWNPNAEFDRTRDFYGLFALGPQVLLDTIKRERKYTFEEYQAMLNLQCGKDQAPGQAAVTQAINRKYNTYVIELHGLELEHSSVDPES